MNIRTHYYLTANLLTLFLCSLAASVNATHISKPVLVEPNTHYRIGETVIINGWVDYNAQPTADVLLHFKVATQDGKVLAEDSFPSDKQGHFHFEFDTKNQLPGSYTITVTSHCLEIHRPLCSFNSETLIFKLDNP